jgi:hypothetical protein
VRAGARRTLIESRKIHLCISAKPKHGRANWSRNQHVRISV